MPKLSRSTQTEIIIILKDLTVFLFYIECFYLLRTNKY